MAFEFTETLNISFPNIDESLGVVESKDSDKPTKGLIVEVAAIHVGATANFNYYTEEALEGSLTSWTEPYGKPIILNHDPYSESVGRVIGATMDTSSDGTPFVRLQAAITSPEAVQKVKDKRYLTGSVGGKAEEARCTICDTDWAAKEARMPACAHRKGKVYEGKVAFLKMQKVKFHEYSWVNMPADENSQVLSMSEADVGKCFILDLDTDTPTIETFNDSAEKVNVLSEMKKKEALPIYMSLKGSFLTALALQESENATNLTKDIENEESNNTNTDSNKISEENLMSKTSERNDDVDLLDVIEGLEEDSKSAEEDTTDSDETEKDAEASSEDEANEDDGKDAEGQEGSDAKDVDDSKDEESEEDAEGTNDKEEEPKTATDTDDDSDNNKDSDENKDDEESAEDDSEEKSEEESDSSLVDEGEADEVSESAEEDSDSESELAERIEQLEEENARLRKAVHRMLAERVVDAKIAVGIDVGDRAEAIKEHSERTAASLADSIRDLSSMSPKASEEVDEDENDDARPEKLKSEIAAAEDEGNNSVFDDQEEAEDVTEGESPEDFFVDAFMGRKPL